MQKAPQGHQLLVRKALFYFQFHPAVCTKDNIVSDCLSLPIKKDYHSQKYPKTLNNFVSNVYTNPKEEHL
jgi:hypothetical protein